MAKKSVASSESETRSTGVDPKLLAMRVESLLPRGFATTKPMFGGITFLRRGNMLCCVSRKGLMVRVGAEAEAVALRSKFATRCSATGRPMPGFVIVEHAGLEDDGDIADWLKMARDYVEPLPEKTSKPASRTTKSKR